MGTEWYMSGDIFLDSCSGFSRASVFFAFLLSGLFLVFHMCRCLLTCLSLVFRRFACPLRLTIFFAVHFIVSLIRAFFVLLVIVSAFLAGIGFLMLRLVGVMFSSQHRRLILRWFWKRARFFSESSK